MKVVYTTINGVIVHEVRNGVQRNYRPDTLGNTIALTDATTTTDTWVYWPYGEVRTRTGTTATPFQFVGTLGYYQNTGSNLAYVRARFYQATRGRWASVDPIWPWEHAYGYGELQPTNFTDPTGMGLVAVIGLTVAGFLTCAAAGLLAYNHYARDVFPFPNDDLGHCMAACMINTYMPWCAVLTPWASECVGEFTWRDIFANTVGTGCGLVQSVPVWPKIWPPAAEKSCLVCCLFWLRIVFPP